MSGYWDTLTSSCLGISSSASISLGWDAPWGSGQPWKFCYLLAVFEEWGIAGVILPFVLLFLFCKAAVQRLQLWNLMATKVSLPMFQMPFTGPHSQQSPLQQRVSCLPDRIQVQKWARATQSSLPAQISYGWANCTPPSLGSEDKEMLQHVHRTSFFSHFVLCLKYFSSEVRRGSNVYRAVILHWLLHEAVGSYTAL